MNTLIQVPQGSQKAADLKSRSALRWLRTGKWVDGFEPRKPAEVAVSGDDLGNAVFEAQGHNEYVRIDRLHRLTPNHEVEQGVSVKQINPGQFSGFPAPQPQLVASLRTGTQRATQQVIGYRLESAAFFGGLFLQFTKKLVIDRQSGSCHMQNHPSYASRCQRAWSAGLKVRRVPIFDGRMTRFEVDP